jgi:hypothetical protein
MAAQSDQNAAGIRIALAEHDAVAAIGLAEAKGGLDPEASLDTRFNHA